MGGVVHPRLLPVPQAAPAGGGARRTRAARRDRPRGAGPEREVDAAQRRPVFGERPAGLRLRLAPRERWGDDLPNGVGQAGAAHRRMMTRHPQVAIHAVSGPAAYRARASPLGGPRRGREHARRRGAESVAATPASFGGGVRGHEVQPVGAVPGKSFGQGRVSGPRARSHGSAKPGWGRACTDFGPPIPPLWHMPCLPCYKRVLFPPPDQCRQQGRRAALRFDGRRVGSLSRFRPRKD